MTLDRAPAVATPDVLDARLAAIGVVVESAAAAAAQLWRDAYVDDDRTARLIEVSHALHRASLALSDVDAIGYGTTLSAVPALATGASSTLATDTRRRTEGECAERWRLLVDAVDEYAIFMLDPVGTVVTWNAGAQRIKGYTADEILGRHFSVFYTADDLRADKPEYHLAHAAEHHHCQDEGWRVRGDGTRFWANVVITALFAADGKLAGFAKIARDETDRNRAEADARRHQQLVDREQLAFELSDTVIHRMFGAGLDMQCALLLITDPFAAERIEHAVEILDGTINDIRDVVLGLNTDR